MKTVMNFDITIGSSYLLSFKDSNLEMYMVFREFIDNSLQSFLDHKDALPNNGKCVLSIEWSEDQIKITDNAFGMNAEEFKRALKLGEQSPNKDREDQLSVYGVGLKSAAFRAANKVSISTVQYQSGIKISTELSAATLRKSPKTNPVTIEDGQSPDLHYTVITLRDLQDTAYPKTATVSKVKENLAKIYKYFLAENTLELSINNERIEDDDPDYASDEYDVKKVTLVSNDIGFEFEGKRYPYSGTIGVLNKGDTSGKTTGLTYYQANRAIVLNDHPERLFGSKNDFRFQRVVGFIKLEGTNWPITQNKDKINWTDDLMNVFLNDLAKSKKAQEIFEFAKSLRKRTPDSLGKLLKSLGQDGDETPKPVSKPQNGSGEKTDEPAISGVPSPAMPVNAVKNAIQPDQDEITEEGEIATVRSGESVYRINIKFISNDPSEPFIRVLSPEEGDDCFCKLSINKDSPRIKMFTKNGQGLKTVVVLCEAFAIALINSKKDGLDPLTIQKITNNLNDFIKTDE